MIKSGINESGDRAGQEWTHIICDVTKIIVNDGVTLYPGYIEVKAGEMFTNFSDDPNNTINPMLMDPEGKPTGVNPAFKLGMLTNRVEFIRTEGPVPAPESAPDGHYLDLDVLTRFALAITAASETTGAVEEEASEEEIIVIEETPVEDIVSTDEEAVETASEPPVESSANDPVEQTPETETPTTEGDTSIPSEADEPVTGGEEESKTDIEGSGVDVSTDAPASEDPQPASDPAEETAPTGTSVAHLIDVNGIQRCNTCMLPAGAMGGSPEEIVAHLDTHGVAEPTDETPADPMMTTETHNV